MPTPSSATSPSVTLPSAVLPSERKFPRSRRIGGYVMAHKTAEKWAARLLGVKELDPSRICVATQYINKSIKQYGAKIRLVGEELIGPCMIVTQMAYFKGYKDMPSSEITQFVPGEREKVAYDFIISQGMCILSLLQRRSRNDLYRLGVEAQDIDFQTWLD